MKYPPPTVGKFRTVTKLTVRKFRTLLLVNQGRVVCGDARGRGWCCLGGCRRHLRLRARNAIPAGAPPDPGAPEARANMSDETFAETAGIDSCGRWMAVRSV